MNERFLVTTAAGQPVIRTNSERDAHRYSHVLRGRVIDREAVREPVMEGADA